MYYVTTNFFMFGILSIYFKIIQPETNALVATALPPNSVSCCVSFCVFGCVTVSNSLSTGHKQYGGTTDDWKNHGDDH